MSDNSVPEMTFWLIAGSRRECISKNWLAALSVRFLQVAQFSLRAQRRYVIRRVCRACMSALGWELPLDAIWINGSYAQIVTFAKFHLFPDSGLSCGVRQKLAVSPLCPMLQNE
jgi:hypothetical protein